jgi:hypothetical protein
MDFESFALTARLWASRAVSFCSPAASRPMPSLAAALLAHGRPSPLAPVLAAASASASTVGRRAGGHSRPVRRHSPRTPAGPPRTGRSPRTPAGPPWTAPLASDAGRPALDGATRFGRRPARLGRATRLGRRPARLGRRRSLRTPAGPPWTAPLASDAGRLALDGPLASDAGRPALDGATRLGRRPARLGRRHSPRTPAGPPWTAPLASDAGRPALDGATRLGRRPARLGRRRSPRAPAGPPWTAPLASDAGRPALDGPLASDAGRPALDGPLASDAGRPALDGATRLGRRPARLGRRHSPRTPATRLEKFPDSHQIGTRKSIRTGRGAKSSFGPLADADSSRDGPVWLLIIDFPRRHQVLVRESTGRPCLVSLWCESGNSTGRLAGGPVGHYARACGHCARAVASALAGGWPRPRPPGLRATPPATGPAGHAPGHRACGPRPRPPGLRATPPAAGPAGHSPARFPTSQIGGT